jgi:hypothetical protein
MKNSEKHIKETLNHWVVGSIPTRCKRSVRTTYKTKRISFFAALFARFIHVLGPAVWYRPPQEMASVDIPYGTVAELSQAFEQLADDVVSTDPITSEGQNARRLYRTAQRQLEIRARITPDPLIDAVLYDCACKLEDHHEHAH